MPERERGIGMTYRDFLERYRRQRREATPDIRDRLPRAYDCLENQQQGAGPGFSRQRFVAFVSAAAILVASVAAGVLLWPAVDTPPLETDSDVSYIGPSYPDSSVQNSESSDSNPSVVETVPNWYAPGSLTVSPILYGDSGLTEADGFNGFAAARFLDITGCYGAQAGHESCSGVYYDITTQTIVCVTHAVWEALARNGQGGEQTEVYIHFYEPNLGKAVFTLPEAAGKPSYCLDMAAGTYTQLSVSLSQSAGHMGGPGDALSGKPYFITMVPRIGAHVDDVLLIHLESGEVVNILKDATGRYLWDAMDDARLSPGGHYVYYTRMTGDSETDNGPARTTVIYDIGTGESRTFQGEIIHALPDDSRLVVRTPDGIQVVDCTTARSVPFEEAEDLPAQYRYIISTTDRYTDDCLRLLVRDLLTGEEILVTDDFVYAYTLSGDNRYLYYYVRGKAFLVCREIATGEQFSVEVDDVLLSATEKGENGERQLVFEMCLDEESQILFLGYSRTDGIRQDPMKVKLEQEGDPANRLNKIIQGEEFAGILSIGELIREYPQGLVAYEGDGYLYLLYTGLYLYGNNIDSMILMVEDYRTGLLYCVDYSGVHYNLFGDIESLNKDAFNEMMKELPGFYENHVDSDFNIYDIQSLPAGGEEKTRQMLEQAGVPIQPALMDYSVYIKDGAVDKEAMNQRCMNPEWIMKRLQSYFVQKKGDASSYYTAVETTQDKVDMEELLEYLWRQERRTISFEDQQAYRRGNYYWITLNTNDSSIPNMIIGQKDGKPFVLWYDYVMEISQEAYDKMLPWLEYQTFRCKG